MDNIDFTSVTEITGYNVTTEQLQRMFTRYHFASDFCLQKDVLEVACGTGQGLGYLKKKAKKVVGGDFDGKIVRLAQQYYKDRVEIIQLDAHELPFANRSFDVIICYEALYYLRNPERFLAESGRVLRENGVLILGTANKDWPGFNPSPYSYRYFSAHELQTLLSVNGFEVSLFADCPVRAETIKEMILSGVKQLAVRLRLMPKTMKGKEKLKRLFVGKLKTLPPELSENMMPYIPPTPISTDSIVSDYKVLFAVGKKRSDMAL